MHQINIYIYIYTIIKYIKHIVKHINKSNKSSISVGYLGYKDYLNLVKLKKIVKSDIHCYAVNTLPTIRSLDEIVYIPHLNYSEDTYWEKKIKVKYLYDEYLNLKDNFNQE